MKSKILLLFLLLPALISCTDKQTKKEIQSHQAAAQLQIYINQIKKDRDETLDRFVKEMPLEDKIAQMFIENLEGNKKFVFATDVELNSNDFDISPMHEAVFRNADCLVIDSQYTTEEAYRKQNWGHSAFCYAVDFAVHWNIKNLYLFHHEPTYDDKKLDSILQAARWYAQYIAHQDIYIDLAKEDMEIEL